MLGTEATYFPINHILESESIREQREQPENNSLRDSSGQLIFRDRRRRPHFPIVCVCQHSSGEEVPLV